MIQQSPNRDSMEQVFLSGNGKWTFAVMQSRNGKTRRLERFVFAANKTSVTATPDKSIPIPFGYGVWTTPDGRIAIVHELAAGGRPDRLLAYDLAAKKPERPTWTRLSPAGEEHRPEACLTNDGKRVIILSEDDTVEVWDGPAGKRVRELPKLPKYYHDGNRECAASTYRSTASAWP